MHGKKCGAMPDWELLDPEVCKGRLCYAETNSSDAGCHDSSYKHCVALLAFHAQHLLRLARAASPASVGRCNTAHISRPAWTTPPDWSTPFALLTQRLAGRGLFERGKSNTSGVNSLAMHSYKRSVSVVFPQCKLFGIVQHVVEQKAC